MKTHLVYKTIIAIALSLQFCNIEQGPQVLVGNDLVSGLVSYKTHIQPIFDAYCSSSCHLKASGAVAGLSLVNYAALMSGCNSGIALIPGSSKDSLIIKRLNGSILPFMPAGGEPFTANQIQNIANWIDQGALDN